MFGVCFLLVGDLLSECDALWCCYVDSFVKSVGAVALLVGIA